MENDYITDVERKVWDKEEGVNILIKPSELFPEEWVTITTEHCEDAKEFYGSITLSLPKGMARAIGEALIAQAGGV